MGLARSKSPTKRAPKGRAKAGSSPVAKPADGSAAGPRGRVTAADRRRLAEVLHDGPLRIATAANIRLQALRRFIDDPEASEALDEAILLIREVIASMRDLLRPGSGAVGDDPLATRLQRAAARWSEMTGMRVHLNVPDGASDDPSEFSPEALDVAEQVIGESIVNAWKHGGARQMSVDVYPRKGGVMLTLRDDGSGLRPATGTDTLSGTKLGLRLLRSRISELGGWFHVRSPQGGGTTVKAWIPSGQPPTSGEA